MWGILVLPGSCSEAEGAKRLFLQVKAGLTQLEVVWLDGGYEHRIEAWVETHCAFRVEIIKRSARQQGWELLPKRWVVERTFAWLGRWRGLAREYDYRPETTQAKIILAMSRLMLRRLTA